MNEPKAFRCANCGQMLPVSHTGVSKCKYCGTEYKVDDDWATPLRIETLPFKSVTLAGKVKIPFYIVEDNPEKAFEYSLHQMAHDMAEKIMPYMDLDVEKDIRTFETTMFARLRVAVPDNPPREVLKRAIAVNAETVKAE